MNVPELIAELTKHADQGNNFQVEIATCPRPDEWYEITDITIETNHRNHLVVVINTD